jgi:aspartate aminotransferase-like enzyme
MGASASRRNVLTCLAALEHVLRVQGFTCEPGAAVEAAKQRYGEAAVTAKEGR